MNEQKEKIEDIEKLESYEKVKDKNLDMEDENLREKKEKGKKKRKQSVLFLTKELFFYRLKAYFGIELFYIIASMLVLFPVFNQLSYQVLRKVGYSYLTSELMLDFFLHPLVIFSLIVMLFMIGIILMWLLTMAINILYYWRIQKQCTVWHLILSSVKRFFMLLKQKNILILLDTWIFVLFFNIPVLIWIFTNYRMPKYIFNSFLKIRFVKEIIIILAILGLADALLHFWEMPYIILEGMTRKEARRKSRNLWKKHIAGTLCCSLLLQVISTIILVVIYIIVLAAGAVVVLLFIPNNLKISVYWTMHDHVLVYIAITIAIVESLMHMPFMMASYYMYKEDIKEEHNIVGYEEVRNGREKIVHKKLIVCSVFLLLCLDIFFTYDNIYNGGDGIFASIDTIKVTAHRGSSLEAPENTIPAIEAAINAMADYVEIDVQLTKDGEVVLMHDSSLKRTTGEKGSVEDYTFEELQKFDAGIWFGSEFAGTKIPKLDEVLLLCKGRIKLNIELKSQKNADNLEKKVVGLIEQYEFQKQCVVTSTYQKTLRIIKELNPDIRTGYIISSAYGNYFDDDNIDFFSMKSGFVTEGIIQRAHKRSKEVHVWTVNTEKEMNRMSQLGVDNIITDVPVEVKEFLCGEDDNSTLFGLLKLILK